jgi:hypothetical protein
VSEFLGGVFLGVGLSGAFFCLTMVACHNAMTRSLAAMTAAVHDAKGVLARMESRSKDCRDDADFWKHQHNDEEDWLE